MTQVPRKQTRAVAVKTEPASMPAADMMEGFTART